MISESILTKLLGLSGHSLLGHYQTTPLHIGFTLKLRSQCERDVLEIHLLEMRYFNSL